MNTPKQAIEKAIEGGWRSTDVPVIEQEGVRLWIRFEREEKGKHLPILWESDVAFDPTFWQALGKALGWGDSCWHGGAVYRHKAVCGVGRYEWQAHAIRFYDLTLTGGDKPIKVFDGEHKTTTAIDVFWKELLHD